MLRFSWDVYFHLIASLVNPLFRFLFHTTHFVYQVCMNDCPLWIQQWTLGVIPEQLKIYFWLKNFKPRHSGRGGRETILSIQKTMQGRVKQYIEYRSKVENTGTKCGRRDEPWRRRVQYFWTWAESGLSVWSAQKRRWGRVKHPGWTEKDPRRLGLCLREKSNDHKTCPQPGKIQAEKQNGEEVDIKRLNGFWLN